MTSLEVSVKDVFFVAVALIAVAITAYAPIILIPRLGRVWRREETGLGWLELALTGSMRISGHRGHLDQVIADSRIDMVDTKIGSSRTPRSASRTPYM